jgi:hypothetical protein
VFILPARAKLFSEAWLILSENGLSMPLSFLFDKNGHLVSYRLGCGLTTEEMDSVAYGLI